jgi:undecaprenyl phosphate N,N'-diacetylbacillosamine 1-phosphate transferase
MYNPFLKRFLDFCLALIGLIVLSPIFLILIITLSFHNGMKPFFLQPRPGKDGVIFKLIKFKSMNDKTDAHGEPLPYHLRVTKIGEFIRKYSLDEIPQLLNVLKGEMSLIGPRPLLVKYLSLYNDFQNQRHNVKPGITGWAQVNGRNNISWEEKFKLDVWYTEHISFFLDLKIILLTFKKVIYKDGVNSSENVNMQTFNG